MLVEAIIDVIISHWHIMDWNSHELALRKLRFCSHLLKKSLMENFIFEQCHPSITNGPFDQVSKPLTWMDGEAYSEPSQLSTMKLYANIVHGWKPLTIFAKSSILDVWLVSECACEMHKNFKVSACLFKLILWLPPRC